MIALNEYGRYAAIALLAMFGLTLVFSPLATRMSRPFVALGGRMFEAKSDQQSERRTTVFPLLLGVSPGLLWTPCAGPILGLILTGAVLNRANVGTSLVLIAYAFGACTSLAAALLFGGRLVSALKRSLITGEMVRRAVGVVVVLGAGAIALGLGTEVISQFSFRTTSTLEKALVEHLQRPIFPKESL